MFRLAEDVELSGVGLHSGAPCRLTLHATDVEMWRIRSGSESYPIAQCRVVEDAYQTTLELPNGARVSTVEHVLAALSGLRIWADISLDGPEMPALDGASGTCCEALGSAALTPSNRRELVLTAPVTVDGPNGERLVAGPATQRTVDVRLVFPGWQSQHTWTDVGDFGHNIAPARTFADAEWVEDLRARGLALGGSLDNALVLRADGQPINPGGFALTDEPARHKILDLVGDLALLGLPLRAHIEAFKPGHRMNHALVAAIARESVEVDAGASADPG